MNEWYLLLMFSVAAQERVTDFRTSVSGIRKLDLVGAPSFAEVQKKVSALLQGKILVGHAVKNDLDVSLQGIALRRPGALR